MSYSVQELRAIFARTNGQCSLCGGELDFNAYGTTGPKGWEGDHSKALAVGGTHSLRNLYAAHASCNRSKGVRSARSVREENGLSRIPMSAAKVQELRWQRAQGFGWIAFLGSFLFRPQMAMSNRLAITAAAGFIGYSTSPKG